MEKMAVEVRCKIHYAAAAAWTSLLFHPHPARVEGPHVAIVFLEHFVYTRSNFFNLPQKVSIFMFNVTTTYYIIC